MKKRSRYEVTPIPTVYEEEAVKLQTPEWNDETRQTVKQLQTYYSCKTPLYQTDSGTTIPTYYSCKTPLYQQSSPSRPALPKATTDIDLQGKWCLTTAGDHFLLPDDNIYPRMLILPTTSNRRHLAAADTIFCDDTFSACPSLFHQLYTIHVMIDGSMYSLVFGLLSGKDQTNYIRFFSHIKDLSRQQNIYLQPQTVFIDYEIATNNAATTVFPGVTIKGCFFHYTQCIWRETQKCGLQTYYKKNDDITKLVRRAAVLPLVPQKYSFCIGSRVSSRGFIVLMGQSS